MCRPPLTRRPFYLWTTAGALICCSTAATRAIFSCLPRIIAISGICSKRHRINKKCYNENNFFHISSPKKPPWCWGGWKLRTININSATYSPYGLFCRLPAIAGYACKFRFTWCVCWWVLTPKGRHQPAYAFHFIRFDMDWQECNSVWIVFILKKGALAPFPFTSLRCSISDWGRKSL